MTNTSELPLEVQERLARINAQAGEYGEPIRQPPPTMMDLLLGLKQEVTEMRAQLQAQGQLTEAVGQAVSQIYLMLQQREQQITNTTIEQETNDYYSDDF